MLMTHATVDTVENGYIVSLCEHRVRVALTDEQLLEALKGLVASPDQVRAEASRPEEEIAAERTARIKGRSSQIIDGILAGIAASFGMEVGALKASLKVAFEHVDGIGGIDLGPLAGVFGGGPSPAPAAREPRPGPAADAPSTRPAETADVPPTAAPAGPGL